MSGASEKKGVLAKSGRAVRLVVGSPATAVGASGIRQGFGLLQMLWGVVRRKPRASDGFVLDDRGRIDVAATASAFEVSLEAVEIYLQDQQNTAYRHAWIATLLGSVLLSAWIFIGFFGTWRSQSVVTAIEMIPFWCALGLYILQKGWMNWQLRRRQHAGFMEYVRDADSLWPRKA
ncbi:hypothetical protein [Gluconobacter oxydans]|uniref:Uncharacterized protein n=1 Tax=Gluconobacter oxydans TaxID=442 RepID=A0A149S1U4_GLUOY|nr:hypothetical protein [Gluconobacter oxydans]KXV20690.1 hypothetical protein AD934_02920 [Gluconobacter oxydans]